jgi:hypothetical protein
MTASGGSGYKLRMIRANIHFPQQHITVVFDSEYAFVKWLGYLKEHGIATAKLAEAGKSVIVFREQIAYIESQEGDLSIG